MAAPTTKSKFLGPVQALFWTGLGALVAALVNHFFIEKREVVEARLEAYKAFGDGQAKLEYARGVSKKNGPDAARNLFEEANEKIDAAKYGVVYLGSRNTIEAMASYFEAAFDYDFCGPNTGRKTPHNAKFKDDAQRVTKLDQAIYQSMRADVKRAFTKTVCPYHAAILLYGCKLKKPYCADGDHECRKACSRLLPSD